MSKKNFCVANWKMNMTSKESKEFLTNFNKYKLLDDINYIICPSYTSLNEVNQFNENKKYYLGAQDVSINIKGSYTGEISFNMLEECNCDYVIIGHSERREFFNETDDKINKKVTILQKTNLIPIVCIGEQFEDRKNKKEFDVIKKQIINIFKNVIFNDNDDIIIAYEPVWAIGSGQAADTETIKKMHNYIKNIIKKMYKNNCNIYLLYGGSVNVTNAKEIASLENVNGFLIGSASLEPNEFYNISKSL